MRNARALALFGLIGALLAGCVNAVQMEDENQTNASTDLGVVLSLSGPNAVYGQSTRNGIELALADHNGSGDSTLSASFLDDGGERESGVSRFQELVDQDVRAILGPTLSNTAFAAHPVAQDAGVPVVAVSNTAEGITETGDYIFRVSLSEQVVIPQTVGMMVSMFAPETAALIYSGDDAWASSSADAFRSAAAEQGIEIVVEQDVPADGSDFADAIRSVGEAAPDVVFLSLLGHTAVGVVLELQAQSIDLPTACGNGCNTPTFMENAGPGAEGVILGSAWHIDGPSEQSAGFIQRYRETFGTDPDQFAAQGYAGVQVIAEAIRRAGSDDRQAIRDALTTIQDFQTVLGTFSFDDHRDGHHPAVIKQVQDGTFVVLGK